MKLSHKDKSLVLFVVAILVVLWAIFSVFSSAFFAATFGISDIKKIETPEKEKWFNTSKPLEISDLKNRVILLDFWSYSCMSCVQALPEISKLQQQFGSKLVVIGIHSGKFANEKSAEAVKKAVLKYDITYPVINDGDSKIWNNFAVEQMPTFMLINPHGNIYKTYVGADELQKIKPDIKKLIAKYKFQINREPLPLMPEKYDVIGNVLSFPSKLEYAADFKLGARQIPAIFIANSGQNNIVVTSLTGDMLLKIGSGRAGFEDGSFDLASFNSPRGMIYRGGKLYVADSGNHAIREIDFKESRVKTILGLGTRGDVIEDLAGIDVKNLELSSPTDVEFFPQESRDSIAIANSGTNQILAFNLADKSLKILAGNGAEGIIDGTYPENTLAQTADMSVYGHKLYFVDSKTSSLRVLDEAGAVKTLIGVDLVRFGHVNGDKSKALMQNPMALLADDTGVYISDSFNHVIRKYDFATMQLRDLAGTTKAGKNLGGMVQFDEPDGIVAVLDRFYIADSNNNRIVTLNRGSLNSELLDVMPPLKLAKEGFLQYLPNLKKSPDAELIEGKEIAVALDLRAGWKINEAGPSFINLLEVNGDQANLVAVFDWQEIRKKQFKLPKLTAAKNYVLQGVVYFCEDKPNALCYVNSYEQNLVVDSSKKDDHLIVKLAY